MLNKVMLIGHLGRDAELRYTQSGQAKASFNLATTEAWTDRGGERQEKTEWHRVVYWGKPAEAVSGYLVKGKQVFVEGSLTTREYTDKDNVKRWTTEVRAFRVQLLGKKENGGPRRRPAAPDDDLDAPMPEPVATPAATDDEPFDDQF